MPTLMLSIDDRERLRAEMNRIVADLERSETKDAAAVEVLHRYIRLRVALENAVTGGNVDVNPALNLLDDVENAKEKPVFLLKANLSTEKYEHAVRLRACGILDGHQDHNGVHVKGLTDKGAALRTFLACWKNPVIDCGGRRVGAAGV
jgi:hypothetical protein